MYLAGGVGIFDVRICGDTCVCRCVSDVLESCRLVAHNWLLC